MPDTRRLADPGPFPPLPPSRDEPTTVYFPPNPFPNGDPLAACQVRIDYLLADPTQVYVYPVPDFCEPGLGIALAAAIAALMQAGITVLPGR